jgi:hypothetical protein
VKDISSKLQNKKTDSHREADDISTLWSDEITSDLHHKPQPLKQPTKDSDDEFVDWSSL